MSAFIGPSTKRNTAEQKNIYENSDQILALDVSLFVQIIRKHQNIVCHNNISPPID